MGDLHAILELQALGLDAGDERGPARVGGDARHDPRRGLLACTMHKGYGLAGIRATSATKTCSCPSHQLPHGVAMVSCPATAGATSMLRGSLLVQG